MASMLFYEKYMQLPFLKNRVFCYDGKYATFSCGPAVPLLGMLAERTKVYFRVMDKVPN